MQEGDSRCKRFQRLTTWRIFLEENLESFFKEFRTKIQYFGALLEELQCIFLCLFPMVYGCYLQEMRNGQAHGYHEPTCSQAYGGMSLPFQLMVYLTAVLVGVPQSTQVCFVISLIMPNLLTATLFHTHGCQSL